MEYVSRRCAFHMKKLTKQEKVSEFIGFFLSIILTLSIIFFLYSDYILSDAEDILETNMGGLGNFLFILILIGLGASYIIAFQIIDYIFFVNIHEQSKKKFKEAKRKVRKLYREDEITNKEKKIRYKQLEIIKMQDEIDELKK